MAAQSGVARVGCALVGLTRAASAAAREQEAVPIRINRWDLCTELYSWGATSNALPAVYHTDPSEFIAGNVRFAA